MSRAKKPAAEAPAEAPTKDVEEPAVDSVASAPTSDESEDDSDAPPVAARSPSDEEPAGDAADPMWAKMTHILEKHPPTVATWVDAPTVERFKVTENCRYVRDGVISTWPKGMVIDSLNFDLSDVKAQGIPLEKCDESAIDRTPAVGHRSV